MPTNHRPDLPGAAPGRTAPARAGARATGAPAGASVRTGRTGKAGPLPVPGGTTGEGA